MDAQEEYNDAIREPYLKQLAQMRAALERIRDEAATMQNGGAWAAGLACLCLASLSNIGGSFVQQTRVDRKPSKPACHFCKRQHGVPCRNTRDMDPDDGLNNDPVCYAALVVIGGGERGRK